MSTLKSLCKICKMPVKLLHDHQFNTDYLRCTSCGFIYLSPEFHVSFNEERVEYDLHENSEEDAGYVNYLNSFLKKAVDPFIEGGSTMDFGCGPQPVISKLMQARGFEAVYYDLHYFKDKAVLQHQYDLITASEVFEHFKEPLEEMQRLNMCLKSGGYLAVMTHVPPTDEAFQTWAYRREQTHIAFYTRQAMEQLARQFGMEIVYHDNKKITVFHKCYGNKM